MIMQYDAVENYMFLQIHNWGKWLDLLCGSSQELYISIYSLQVQGRNPEALIQNVEVRSFLRVAASHEDGKHSS